jgi:hypothetical protein
MDLLRSMEKSAVRPSSRFVSIAASARGSQLADQLVIRASLQQTFRGRFHQRHVRELLAVETSLAELTARSGSETRGDSAARSEIRELQKDRKALIKERDWAVQQVLAAIDPDDVSDLIKNPHFCAALYDKGDPDSVVDAILAVHRSRSGGPDSLYDSAAALRAFTEDLHPELSLHAYLTRVSDRLLPVLPNPADFPGTVTKAQRPFLERSHARLIMFICAMLLSDATREAIRQIESSLIEPAALAELTLDAFATRVVSQRSLGLVARERKATVLTATRGPVLTRTQPSAGGRPRFTCYRCQQPGHLARDCQAQDPVASPAVAPGEAAAAPTATSLAAVTLGVAPVELLSDGDSGSETEYA